MTDTAAPATPVPASRYAAARPKVPAFARFKGTSAWKKYPRRARAYAAYLASTKKA